VDNSKHAAVAVLNVGGSDQGVEQKTELVDQNVTLLALDQLAGVKAVVDRSTAPLFLRSFTLWLSTMQAVGLASRSACSLHFT